MDVYSTTEGRAEELIADMKGEKITYDIVRQAVHELGIDWKPSPTEEEGIFSIECGDGTLTQYHVDTLRRNFTLIDDFLSEFPTCKNLKVSYTMKQIKGALYGLGRGIPNSLASYLSCIRHLNPKSPTYYLRYSLGGTSLSDLYEITSLLSDQERASLLEVRRWQNRDYPLPEEGEGLGILGCICEAYRDMKTARRLFPSYPSYLVSLALTIGQRDELHSLLLHTDFNDDSGWLEESCSTSVQIQNTILELLRDSTRTWEEVRRFTTMLGIRHDLLENKELAVSLPYQLRCTAHAIKMLHTYNHISDMTQSIARVISSASSYNIGFEAAMSILQSTS